ncbi:hypothetical protein AM571_PB00307 (plasmid) [Rhizobium etli 8C-3]|uniref:Uncharacterized protein n=1 Tax=Rhizobium etli 8C-3 TaxID=538025 RepID=A0A1L5PBY7_RHIET|nr:hypothetical protein AM571_PB00307 [Rhizobium etli 8C-3]ARO26935.1 hypothetical protein TAL182_PC00332 [Rhizobium sp. TAL182]
MRRCRFVETRRDIVRALLMQLHLGSEQIGKLFLGSFCSWHDFWIYHMPRDWSFVYQQWAPSRP